MRDAQQLEQGGLLDLVLDALVGVVAGKRVLAGGVEQVGIERRRVIHGCRATDQFPLLPAVVIEVGANPEGDHVPAFPEPPFQGNYGPFEIHKTARILTA